MNHQNTPFPINVKAGNIFFRYLFFVIFSCILPAQATEVCPSIAIVKYANHKKTPEYQAFIAEPMGHCNVAGDTFDINVQARLRVTPSKTLNSAKEFHIPTFIAIISHSGDILDKLELPQMITLEKDTIFDETITLPLHFTLSQYGQPSSGAPLQLMLGIQDDVASQ